MRAGESMTLTRDQMAQMSRLLDEALPLTDSERRVWLDNLPSDCRGLAELLREALLPSDAAAPGPEQLATIPKIGIVEDVDSLPNGLEPGARVGPYELIRPLGAGGMAEVWLARRADGALKREVALKLPLLMRVHRDLPQRFVRERDILAGLEHPNIARLYDAGFAADGQPYLALEYVVGKPITEYCDEHRLSVRQRLELFRQVLSAVQYAHAHLVIHRDLKPSNILVRGRTGRAPRLRHRQAPERRPRARDPADSVRRPSLDARLCRAGADHGHLDHHGSGCLRARCDSL